MKYFNKNVAAAIGRHAIQFAAGGVTVAAGVAAYGTVTHTLSADQAGALTSAVGDIANGVKSIVGGLSVLVGLATAAYAGWTATHASQAAAVASVDGAKVITRPDIAAAANSPDVVPNTKALVVAK